MKLRNILNTVIFLAVTAASGCMGVDSYVQKAAELSKAGNHKEAVAVLITAYEADPTNTLVLKKLGKEFADINRLGYAVSCFFEASHLDKSDVEARQLFNRANQVYAMRIAMRNGGSYSGTISTRTFSRIFKEDRDAIKRSIGM